MAIDINFLIKYNSAQFQLNVWTCSEIMVDGWDGCINNHKMFIQNFLFIFHFQLKLVNIEILFLSVAPHYSCDHIYSNSILF